MQSQYYLMEKVIYKWNDNSETVYFNNNVAASIWGNVFAIKSFTLKLSF